MHEKDNGATARGHGLNFTMKNINQVFINESCDATSTTKDLWNKPGSIYPSKPVIMVSHPSLLTDLLPLFRSKLGKSMKVSTEHLEGNTSVLEAFLLVFFPDLSHNSSLNVTITQGAL